MEYKLTLPLKDDDIKKIKAGGKERTLYSAKIVVIQ